VVERKSRTLILTKMENATAEAALKGFTREMSKIPQGLRTSLTYDQGKEMARHQELAKRLDINIYFCHPPSPWERPTNENTNGLIRQYLPKGTDLSGFTQKQLNKIAQSLNDRPRQALGFLTPNEVYSQQIANLPVALQI